MYKVMVSLSVNALLESIEGEYDGVLYDDYDEALAVMDEADQQEEVSVAWIEEVE